MDSLGLWVQPALMLPGVALLLMTTITRFGQLEMQMYYAMDGEDRPHLPVDRLRRCETLLRWATISLYGSVCALALGSLFGGLTVSIRTLRGRSSSALSLSESPWWS